MAKFRKKPVVIEALSFEEAADAIYLRVSNDSTSWLIDAVDKGLVRLIFYGISISEHFYEISIKTLEGVVYATNEDMILRGVEGEIYPCKKNIFAATYEPVEE